MVEIYDNLLLKNRNFIASSVGECMQAVDEICKLFEYDRTIVEKPVVWFRGHSQATFRLEPTLYRSMYETKCVNNESKDICKKIKCINSTGQYGTIQTAEEIRYENYKAKNIGLSKTGMAYGRLEWLEHMQHHGTKTRLLDWTESLIHAILFAVEPLIDPKATIDSKDKLSPEICLLFPQILNAYVLNRFQGNKNNESKDNKIENKFIDKWLEEYKFINYSKREKIKEKIFNAIDRETCIFVGTGRPADNKFNLLFNLSVIQNQVEKLEAQNRLIQTLLQGCIINPLYPLLTEYYTYGLPVEKNDLPPLAFVQERHSTRIYAQRGVFTIFPFYNNISIGSDIHIDMRFMPYVQSCIFHIKLRNCNKIAKELDQFGINRDWLYPEDPIVSETFEQKQF